MGNVPKRVLVVDDTPAMRELIADVAGALGYRAFAVENGEEAVNHLKSEEFDAVITDYNMPVMNGEELTLWIKLNHPNVPVIFASAQDLEDFRDVAEAAGADEVIIKSEIVAKLPEILEKMFEQRRVL